MKIRINRFLAAIAVVVVPSVALAGSPVLINEFMPNPVGGDPSPQDYELRGTPGDPFSGWILTIETDNVTNKGVVDSANAVSGSFDINGLLVASIPDFENPSFTTVLLDTFTGAVGTDIDADDDGIADDLSSFGTVLDAIGIPDAVGDEPLQYGAQLGGTDFTFIGDEPQLVFRDSVTLDLYAVDDNGLPDSIFDVNAVELNPNDFNIDPLVNTFGGVNPTIPEPATIGLLAVGALISLRKRRS